jgi:sulfite reductase (ferredoxin)
MSAEPTVPKPSPVEAIKESSQYLRGTLAAELAADTDHFSEQSKQLVKFHGTYQQEDRDARKKREKPGVGKAYMMMVRLRMPGGVLTADQYLALDDIAQRYGNGTLRFTTRQSIQLHGVLKKNLKSTIAEINHTLLSTISACGDVNRNVMSCSAPLPDAVRKLNNELCNKVADHLTPHAGKKAYHEIWLNGESVTPPSEPEVAEPIYGKVYLPRKFKTAFGLPHDNCVDIYAQCLGFQAITEGGKPVGYNLIVGGGMGMTNSKPETFPHLGREVCYVTPDEVVGAAEAVVKLFRDHGNRSDRKRARIKYLMHDWGVEKFREVFRKDYFGKPLVAPKIVPVTGVDLHLGWHSQGGDRWFYGVSVENGRVKDEGGYRLRSGLRAVASRVRCNVRVTPQQDVLLCDISEKDRSTVDALLVEHGIPQPESLSNIQKWSLACPAIPTCPLAISESERYLPKLVDELEKELAALGLGDIPLSLRMTGCPNGCARPYNSDIGLVGRSGDKYTLYVGGRIEGDRLSFELQDLLPKDRIVPTLKKVLAVYKTDRKDGEGFGDYVTRLGKDTVAAMIGAGE